MMEINKIKYDFKTYYDFELNNGDKNLRIYFANNLDLYMTIDNNKLLPIDENVSMYFDITKENYEIYSLFDTLYKNIISGHIFEDNKLDYTKRWEYKRLVNEQKEIVWISDDGPVVMEDVLKISLLSDESYRLTFIRNDILLSGEIKNPFGICIRFRNSGSKYDPFNVLFMKMFNNLQEIDPEYHQIHIEELEYKRKLQISKSK